MGHCAGHHHVMRWDHSELDRREMTLSAIESEGTRSPSHSYHSVLRDGRALHSCISAVSPGSRLRVGGPRPGLSRGRKRSRRKQARRELKRSLALALSCSAIFGALPSPNLHRVRSTHDKGNEGVEDRKEQARRHGCIAIASLPSSPHQVPSPSPLTSSRWHRL